MRVHVEAGSCTRCGACASLCPGVFDVDEGASRVVRQPVEDERAFVLAAETICPTDAIRVDHDEKTTAAPDTSASLFHELATRAERVRWSLDAIRLGDIDSAKAPPELRAVVREMAFSENATYSATQRFLDSFFDDVDFSQWIAVWFYEETRHPHVLVEWLRRVGEPVSSDFVVKGRVSTPFMRSIVGTLVTNVISEVTASQSYRYLARTSTEPVLRSIARLIAGDEARHAASFFRFAAKELTTKPSARERARGLEVLQAWLGGAQATTHPVAQMIERVSLDMDFAAVRKRVVRVVGLLLDLPLNHDEDVKIVLRGLLEHR